MTTKRKAADVLDREFLELRHRLLDIAAGLDRIDRCDGVTAARKDDRMRQIGDALALLADGRPGRAERIQMVFSDPYNPDWRKA